MFLFPDTLSEFPAWSVEAIPAAIGKEALDVHSTFARRVDTDHPFDQRITTETELRAQGLNATEIYALTPHKFFVGNRPRNTTFLDKLTPKSLGALIALYEQKTFVQGVIWDVNSFDLWGLELGKQLAKTIDAELKSGVLSGLHDRSTKALMRRAIL